VARSCVVAQCDHAGMGGECREGGTGWPCEVSVLARLEVCGESVWAVFVVLVFGDVFG